MSSLLIKELSTQDISQYLARYKDANFYVSSQGYKPRDINGYGAFDNDNVIGAILYIENPKKYTRGLKVQCKILFYFVKKEYRGLGYGKKLIQLVTKKYKTIYLVTNEDSSDMAKKIYKENGFKEIDSSGDNTYWLKGKVEDNIYMVSGLVLGCISPRSSQDKLQMDKYNLKYTEVLKNDSWRGIVESNNPLNKIEVENLLHDHEYDPDNKKIPYYFIVKDISNNKEYVIFTDKDIWYPLNTMSDKIKARDAGLKKGLQLDQVNWPEGIS